MSTYRQLVSERGVRDVDHRGRPLTHGQTSQVREAVFGHDDTGEVPWRSDDRIE
jgi:hypothetical protein